jgi:hypothetical protein
MDNVTAVPEPTDPPEDKSEKSSGKLLSDAASIAIAVGAVLILAMILVTLVIVRRNRKNKK